MNEHSADYVPLAAEQIEGLVKEAIESWTDFPGTERQIAAVMSVLREAQAEAWDEGRRAERRDWEFTFDLTTPDEDRQPWPNPYLSNVPGEEGSR